MTSLRCLRPRVMALALLLTSPGAATAYGVEADSTSNSVFVLLRNLNPSADFQSISLADAHPSFVTQATASIVRGSVPAGGSDLAARDFDVSGADPNLAPPGEALLGIARSQSLRELLAAHSARSGEEDGGPR